MNRQKAVEYDSELHRILKDYAVECGTGEQAATNIMEHYVEFLPDDEIKGFAVLGGDPASYKFGNVRLDLKKALVAALEATAAASRPESVFQVVQLLIVAILFLYNTVRQELNGVETYVIYLLHVKGAYEGSGIEEERFVQDLQEWHLQTAGAKLDRGEIVEAINHLYKLKTADFENGKIFLRERVWARME